MSSTSRISVSEKILAIRNHLGLTQQQMLAHVGFSDGEQADTTSIGRWENDGYEVPLEYVIRLVNRHVALVDYLLGKTETMPNISIDDVVFNTVDIASLRMGERLKLTANRLRLTAQDMADACDCKAITIKTYWGDHNKMPKLSYIQSLLKTFPRYDAYLLGLSACLPGESEGDISYRFRAVNQWLRVSEQVESIADYYDAGKGNTGLTDGMVSKIEAGEAQMPVSALRNLAITQGKQQAALYILGLSDSIQ